MFTRRTIPQLIQPNMVNDQYTFRQSYPVTATPMRKRTAENIRRGIIHAGKSRGEAIPVCFQTIIFTLPPVKKFLGRHIGGEMILGLPLEMFSPLKFGIFSLNPFYLSRTMHTRTCACGHTHILDRHNDNLKFSNRRYISFRKAKGVLSPAE